MATLSASRPKVRSPLRMATRLAVLRLLSLGSGRQAGYEVSHGGAAQHRARRQSSGSKTAAAAYRLRTMSMGTPGCAGQDRGDELQAAAMGGATGQG